MVWHVEFVYPGFTSNRGGLKGLPDEVPCQKNLLPHGKTTKLN